MKIKVIKLQPNPFRSMAHYPIDRGKVEVLKQSIEQTTFWDNLLCRKADGGYQIAFGHHRLVALQELNIEEVDIPVRDFDDATMLRAMAQENREEWGAKPAVIIETVRATRDFLREHPEERKKALGAVHSAVHRESAITQEPGRGAISVFLGWSIRRVERALADLAAIESGDVVEEAMRELPTQEHAQAFRKAVKKAKKETGVILSPKEQVSVAKGIKVEADVKERSKKSGDGEKQKSKKGSAPKKKKTHKSAKATFEDVVSAHIEKAKKLGKSTHVAEEWITEKKVDKVIKKTNDLAKDLLAIKSIKFVLPAQVIGLGKALINLQDVIREVSSEQSEIVE